MILCFERTNKANKSSKSSSIFFAGLRSSFKERQSIVQKCCCQSVFSTNDSILSSKHKDMTLCGQQVNKVTSKLPLWLTEVTWIPTDWGRGTMKQQWRCFICNASDTQDNRRRRARESCEERKTTKTDEAFLPLSFCVNVLCWCCETAAC